jgi:ABC-type branched-subunit amino acid transport system ATPase component
VGWFAGPLLGMGVVATLDRMTLNLTEIQPALFILLLFACLAVLRVNGIVGTVVLSRFGRFFLRLPDMSEELELHATRPVETFVEPAPGDGPMLRALEISKRFGGVQALDRVSLEVKRGTIHGLIGPNGSGKSTFVNLISGFIGVDCGHVQFDGYEYPAPKPHVMAKAGLVRIFQRAETFGRLLVIQNVLMGLHMRADRNMLRCMVPLPGRRRRERALGAEAFAILSAAGLAHRALTPVAILPYGEQRLLEIARAVAARPKLLVLDEPATGLTAPELERLGTLLKTLRRAGLTLLIIEHNMEFLMDLVDEITVFDSGVVIAEGDPEVVQRHPDVVEAYFGEPIPA